MTKPVSYREMTCQLFASPEVDAMLDDEQAEIPFRYVLTSAFLVRLSQDEDFASELADWYDDKPPVRSRRGSRSKMKQRPELCRHSVARPIQTVSRPVRSGLKSQH
jgi:type II secretory pathway component PulK